MQYIDVFNGDADGLCALIQLYLDKPRVSTLITGVKRDISLLERVEAQSGDKITVLDISMAKNQQSLADLLELGCHIFYADHHQSGDIPQHPNLNAQIDLSAEICTSLIIDRYLQGKFSDWAVVGAYGDGLLQSAEALAREIGLSTEDETIYRQLGECLNYNGYGATEEDLHFRPAELFKILAGYQTPTAFIEANAEIYQRLLAGYRDDMKQAWSLEPQHANNYAAIVQLPNEKWARRVSGVFGNALMHASPQRAHAILTENGAGGYLVSVRAPYQNRAGADQLCSQFETGGGRAGAAGINHLPTEEFGRFAELFNSQYGGNYS